MTRKIRRMLCLLLTLTALCTTLMMGASAVEREAENMAVIQPRAASLATPSVTKLENTAAGIKLTWGKVSGAAQYRVFLKISTGWKELGNTTGTSFTYTEAVSGETYTFTVRCISADGKTFTSGYNASGWKQVYIASPVITGFENRLADMQLTWNAVPGAVRYRVFLKSATGWKVLGDTADTSYTYAAVAGGESYTFTVRCVSADGKTFVSGYHANGWTQTFVTQPTIKTLENRVTGVKLTWDSVPGAERYRIYAKVPGGSWDYVGNTTGNTFTYIWVESGEEYIFTIRAANKDNNRLTSAYNETGWGITYIGQPRVTKLENAETGVKLTWDRIPGAERYRVQLKTSSGWKELGSTAEHSFTYTGAKDGETYTFTVSCVNAENTVVVSSCYENGWSHTYDKPLPSVLSTPMVTHLESTSQGIKLTWDSVEGAQMYRVFVKTASGWKVLGDTDSVSYVYKDGALGEKYTFTVRCVDAQSGKFTSAYNTAGWTATYYLATPQITKIENTSAGIKLTWGGVDGALRYRIFVMTSSGWKVVDNTTATSYVYQNVVSGEQYTFTVRCVEAESGKFTSAYDAAGWSVTYLSAPEITKVESSSEGIKLTWDSVEGAQMYRVFVKTASGWKALGNTASASYVYKDGVLGEKYTFTVRCVDAQSGKFTSAYNTAGWTATYYLATPQVTGIKNTSSGVKLTWDAVPGAELYRVFVKTSSGWKSLGNVTGTSFTYKDAVEGTKYTFTVRCVEAGTGKFTSNYNSDGWSITHN